MERRVHLYGVLLVLWLVAVTADAGELGTPSDLYDFNGVVKGVVVEHGELSRVHLKVTQVVRTEKESKATKPGALAGRTIVVAPGLERDGDDDERDAKSRHAEFLKGLAKDQEVVLALKNKRGNLFRLVDLPQEHKGAGRSGQEEGAGHSEHGAGKQVFTGFSGTVKGKILSRDSEEFSLEVLQVVGTHQENAAKHPEALVGKRIVVGPRLSEEDQNPAALQAAFIRRLKAGQELTLEVLKKKNNEHWEIAELTEEQRQLAKGKDESKAEKKKDEKKGKKD